MRRILCVRLPEWSQSPLPGAPARENLSQLARECQRYSPLVGIEASEIPDSLLLDITGGAHLFGGEPRMARQVVADFRRRGFIAHAVVADTIGAAWAVSRVTVGTAIVPPGRQEDALRRLRIEALRIAPETAEVLHALGLSTIGQLMALPRESLPSRFGPEILRRLDQALGHIPEPILPERPEEPIEATWGCEPPVETCAAVEAILRQLLSRVIDRLRRRNAGLLQVAIELSVSAHEPTHFTVGLVRPTLDLQRLLELVRLQLERLRLGGGLSRATLRVTRTALLEADQGALFEGSAFQTIDHRNARRDLDSLLNRLSNRLGHQAVLGSKLSPDYQPERAVEYMSWIEQSKPRRDGKSQRQKAWLDPDRKNREKRPRRPLCLFPEPVPVDVWSVRPDGPPIRLVWRDRDRPDRDQLIVHCEGPERIDTGWWRAPTIQRDYFRADTENGQKLWLFHAREENSWFVHGEF